MNIFSLFQKSDDIDGEQARLLLDRSSSDEIQLVDVRQPAEYSQEHIPGAKLIPLKELDARVSELLPSKKTIVYCRSGVRSKAGCQILRNNGFEDVLNMTGGIVRWHGHKVSGSEVAGFEGFLTGDYPSAFRMAWSMEKALQEFYLLLAEQTDDEQAAELLTFMARLEDGHMARLLAQHGLGGDGDPNGHSSSVLEGGVFKDQFLTAFHSHLGSVEELLHIGMLFEAQAYDLYSRLARQEKDSQLREFYEKMAAEEKNHLAQLTNELERRIV